MDSFARVLGVTHDELGELALKAQSGSGGVVLVPYFEGERTPNLPDATAELVGLTLANNTRENIARAAIEGMLCGLNAGLDALVEAGVACKRIFLVGGAAANPAVQRIAAEIFGVPVVVAEPGEYVANGAARQAAQLVLGKAPAWEIATIATVSSPVSTEVIENYRKAALFAASR
jgi:xylulokinase